MLSIAIVGLPNVGKSTLFNALVKSAQAEAANFPFCTIDPNVGVVEVPDIRLDKLAEISHSQKVVPTAIEFIDIAGLIKDAHKGEGLGNKFLTHIRECDAICEIVRVFSDENIVHVEGKIDPESDIATVETELILKDLESVEKRLQTIEKDAKSGDKNAVKIETILRNILNLLNDNKPARAANLSDDDKKLVKELGLLTLKPILYVANLKEEEISKADELIKPIKKIAGDAPVIAISAKIEADLNELPEEEQKEYLESLGLEESGLNRLISAAYETLGLVTYLTSGEKETRAWTIKKGMTAPQAAGVIHGDFERGFIAADVIKYDDFVKYNGWAGCKEKGLVKTEGKTYVVADGDVMLFKFNV